MRRLATRSSSELYLVYVPDGTHDRLAVLKRLPTALATDPNAVEKFRVEARIAALLEHPSIVRVFEIVETPSEDYYTMEYVRGADMRQLMDALAKQKRTLPLDCVLLIAIELCNALDYAHHLTDANGVPAPVIHRELSPSKVLLGVDGTIKLTGFSAPPTTHARPRRSRTESVGYTSPERYLGETTDSRSDVFALGVLLYELSSGERLFADATTEHQIMTKLVRGDMPRPSEIRRGYPRELERILMRALARDRKERYQSAAELQIDLETFLWSRWPTASTAALAKLVAMTFPPDDNNDLATGSRELERIDPFKPDQAAGEDPVLWLGPVPLAKPYPRVGEGPRTATKDLERSAPKEFPEASNVDLTLGAPGPKARPEDLKRPSTEVSDRAVTVDELAIPVEHAANAQVEIDLDDIAPNELPRPAPALATARRNANVLPATAPVRKRTVTAAQPIVKKQAELVLGTPGAKPSPLAGPNQRALAFDAAREQPASPAPIMVPPVEAPRGQYQRPAALDEDRPADDLIIDKLREKARTRTDENLARLRVVEEAKPERTSNTNLARVELARIATPVALVRADVVRPAMAGAVAVVETPPPAPAPKRAETAGADPQAEFDLDQVSQLNWTLIPSAPAVGPVEAIKQRLPSPPPSSLVVGRARWPLGTIAAIIGVVIVGVMASAWAIRRNVHEPSNLPEVVAAHPSPPTDVVLKSAPPPAPRAQPAAAPAHEEKAVAKAKPRVAAAVVAKPSARPAPRVAEPVPQPASAASPAKTIPPLFPPSDNVGSLDGLPAIKQIEVKGTIADLGVRKAVEQILSPLRGCYRAAARAKQMTPQVDLSLVFEIDSRRMPVKVRAIGGGALDALPTCAAKVTSDIRDLPAPAGVARVTVSLEFRPNP